MFLCMCTLRQSKLCLILDLDHTLVNSARFAEVDAPTAALLEQQEREQARQPPEQRLLHRLLHINMWTKLRPGVRLFLQRAAQFFQLWIHTNGNRCVIWTGAGYNSVRLADYRAAAGSAAAVQQSGD